MSDVYVPQPPDVDAQGNINVHGQGSVSIAVAKWSGDPNQPGTTEVDITGCSLALRIEGLDDIPLVANPNDPLGLLLSIGNLSAAGLVAGPPFRFFALVDTTGADPVVDWQGQIIVRGWE